MPSQAKKKEKNQKGYKIKTPRHCWDIKKKTTPSKLAAQKSGRGRGGGGLSRPPLVERISDAWKTNKKGIKSHLSQSQRTATKPKAETETESQKHPPLRLGPESFGILPGHLPQQGPRRTSLPLETRMLCRNSWAYHAVCSSFWEGRARD